MKTDRNYSILENFVCDPQGTCNCSCNSSMHISWSLTCFYKLFSDFLQEIHYVLCVLLLEFQIPYKHMASTHFISDYGKVSHLEILILIRVWVKYRLTRSSLPNICIYLSFAYTVSSRGMNVVIRRLWYLNASFQNLSIGSWQGTDGTLKIGNLK